LLNGALAGIMFLNILKEKNVNFKYGTVISAILLTTSLFLLWLI